VWTQVSLAQVSRFGIWKAKDKNTAAIFSSSLPICPIYFHLIMPKHVLNPCYAQYEHNKGIKGYVTYYWHVMWGYKSKTCDIIWGYECKTCLGNTWENMDGASWQTGGKNSTVLLYWLHSFPLACLIFRKTMPNMVKVHQCMLTKIIFVIFNEKIHSKFNNFCCRY
jgi:hypothetical protein